MHVKYLDQSATADGASFTLAGPLAQGKGETAEPVLEDERTFKFLPPSGQFYNIIDVTTKLKAIAGDTTFDGDLEHRRASVSAPPQEVDRSKTAYLSIRRGKGRCPQRPGLPVVR